MMETKVIEVRDRATFIPVLAIRMRAYPAAERERHWYIHRRCGYPVDGSGVVMMRLSDQRAYADPYDWADRTHRTAHDCIIRFFDALRDGDVVDVEVVLGEKATPKVSERFSAACH